MRLRQHVEEQEARKSCCYFILLYRDMSVVLKTITFVESINHEPRVVCFSYVTLASSISCNDGTIHRKQKDGD